MNHGSLFSGIGGFDLAAEWMGWNNIFQCEIDPFCRKVLKYYWPDSKLFRDINKANFSKYENSIDIISGGFPCQPFSIAGKRKGTEDYRNLWPKMFETIQKVRPRWIVGENVFGIVNWNRGMVFKQIITDLENSGYEIQTYIIPACAVNAPHRRDRVWFVAHSTSVGREQRSIIGGKVSEEIRRTQYNIRNFTQTEITSHSTDNRNRIRLRTDRNREKKMQINKQQSQFEFRKNSENITNSNKYGFKRRMFTEKSEISRCKFKEFFAQIQSYKWENFPSQSPICSRNDGFPPELVGITVSKHRTESIKAYGNAIVPQVAYEIFKVISKYEKL